jgi:hypothetical protein
LLGQGQGSGWQGKSAGRPDKGLIGLFLADTLEMETAFAAVSFFDVPVATVEIRRRTGFWTEYGIVAAGVRLSQGRLRATSSRL